MTIWILVVVFMASLGALGYRQGGIRVAFSLVGIIISAALALPLGHLVRAAFGPLGAKDLFVIWLVPPVIAFAIVLILFKVAALVVNQKVEVHFKYYAGDLRMALWQRLNHRLGACLGLCNGALYLILISLCIYNVGYATIQFGSEKGDPWKLRLINRLARDSADTGFYKLGAALTRMPADYYNGADFVALLYRNPAMQDRLPAYPLFISLCQRFEFQSLGNDAQLRAMLLRNNTPIMDILDYQSIQQMNTPDSLKMLWGMVQPNLQDLEDFLKTGRSAKYGSEKLLGYWDFDVAATVSAYRKSRASVQPKEMQAVKAWLSGSFAKTTLIAGADHQAFINNLPSLNPAASAANPGGSPPQPQSIQGQWSKSGDHYDISVTLDGAPVSLPATFDKDRLTLTAPALPLVFTPAD